MDFTELSKKSMFLVLVVVCTFSGWMNTHPCGCTDAVMMVKMLTGCVPRWWFAVSLDFEAGAPFASQLMKINCKDLGIKLHFHTP